MRKLANFNTSYVVIKRSTIINVFICYFNFNTSYVVIKQLKSRNFCASSLISIHLMLLLNGDELKKFKELLDSGAISQEEFDARIVLNRIENDYKPRNRKQGELWVDTLENARETKIEPSRLERGIDKAKELLEKVIEIARNMSRGMRR